MKHLLFLFFVVFIVKTSHSQNNEEYVVNGAQLNVRNQPNKEGSILHTLHKGDLVNLIEKTTDSWWFVRFSQGEGYVFSDYLMKTANKKPVETYADWDKKSYLTGETPECENVIPEYDNKIDNYLKVKVDYSTDVVIKLMKIPDSICIRMVYIRGGETFYINHIPEGKYYLKMAYGEDWRQKIKDEKCVGKFVKKPLYEKGEDILDYYLVKKSNGTDIPLYELSLGVIWAENEFESHGITESEFNK